MRQDRRPHQQVVVCKTVARKPDGAEVPRLPRFAPELSCCLQDPPRRGRRAKPVRRNALGPQLRCCLQDCGASASGHGVADSGGFAQQRRDFSAGTASSNRDCGTAISVGCPGRRRGIRDQRRVFCGDHRRADGLDNRLRHRLPGEAGTSTTGRPAGSRDNAVHSYEKRCLIPTTPPPVASEFRICCKVTTASPPMASMRDYITGGNAGVLNRG